MALSIREMIDELQKFDDKSKEVHIYYEGAVRGEIKSIYYLPEENVVVVSEEDDSD